MSDWKSKLPDFKEVVAIASKLATDVTKSVKEIVSDYKKKHPEITTTASVKKEAIQKPTETADKKTEEK